MTVTVKKVGGSVAVIIPKAVACDLELAEGTPLELSSSGGTITMRKRQPSRRPRRPVTKIAAQIKPASYRRRNREVADDRPTGREVW
jgi:antitoxin component of MazEF toxin-antitoxin module